MEKSITFNAGHILDTDGLENSFRAEFSDLYDTKDLIRRIDEREKQPREQRIDVSVEIPVDRIIKVLKNESYSQEARSKMLYLVNEELKTLAQRLTDVNKRISMRIQLSKTEGLSELMEQSKGLVAKAKELTVAVGAIEISLPDDLKDLERAVQLKNSLQQIIAESSKTYRG